MKFQLSVYLNETDFSDYEIDDSFTVGRHKSCRIQILSSIVSSEHCTLVLMPKTKYDENQYYAIRDGVFTGNPSRNGTWVNGERLTPSARLHNQDEITFGARYPKMIFTATKKLDLEEEDISKETGAIDRDSLDLYN